VTLVALWLVMENYRELSPGVMTVPWRTILESTPRYAGIWTEFRTPLMPTKALNSPEVTMSIKWICPHCLRLCLLCPAPLLWGTSSNLRSEKALPLRDEQNLLVPKNVLWDNWWAEYEDMESKILTG
jgi:hypothetical protein